MRHTVRIHQMITALALFLVLAAALPAQALKEDESPPTWSTPQAALEAFVAAAKSGDADRMVAVLGPKSRPIVSSGDPVADRQALQVFLAAVEERVFYQHHGEQKVIVNVGFQNWPMPVPLVRTGKSWSFDSAAGLEEMLNRRIGRNELAAMETLMALVEAQLDYYGQDFDQDEVVEYAARIVSSEGQQDGLYWPVAQGQETSPLVTAERATPGRCRPVEPDPGNAGEGKRRKHAPPPPFPAGGAMNAKDEFFAREQVQLEVAFASRGYGSSMYAGWHAVDEHPRDSKEGMVEFGAAFYY